MSPDLVVHVGLGAASTMLTSALPLLETELARQGVRTAAAGSAPAVDAAPLLVTAPAPTVPSDPSDAWAFCSLQHDEVAAVIERSGARRVRILFSPERQDTLLERAYRAAVAEGFEGDFVERFPRYDTPLIDFGPVARRLRSLPGVEDLRVVPLELVGAGQIAYVGALLDALGCADPIDLQPLAEWAVPAEVGSRGLGVARAMTPHLDTDGERVLVREYLQSAFPAPVGTSPRVMTTELRSSCVRAYRSANQAFFAEFVPELPPASYAGRNGRAVLGSTLSPVEVSAPEAPEPPPRSSGVGDRLRGLRRRFSR